MALQLKLDPSNLEAGAQRAKNALDDVKGKAAQAETAIEALAKGAGQDMARVATVSESAGRAANNLGQSGFAAAGGMRMLGLQLSQVAQQGSVTGNYLGALAVQLPDIMLGFGTLGVAIGAVSAVALPALINALGAGKSAAEQLTEATDQLANAVASLRDISTELSNLDKLEEKYGEVDAQLLQLIGHMRDQQMMLAQTAARDAVRAMAEEYGTLLDLIDAGGRAGQAAQRDLQANLGLTAQQGIALRDAMREAQEAATFDAQIAAMAKVDAILATSTVKGSEFAAAITQAALELRQVEPAAEDSANAISRAASGGTAFASSMEDATGWVTTLRDVMFGAADAAALVVENAPKSGWLDGAIGAAGSLAVTLWNAAAAAAAVGHTQFDPTSGPSFEGGGRNGSTMAPYIPPAKTLDDLIAEASSGNGTGTGAAVDDTRAAYDRLLASLDPVVAKAQDLAEAQQTVNDAFAAGEISAEEQANALDLIAAKYGDTANAMDALRETGGNAIDALIGGTKSLGEALKDMARELVAATIKAQLLKSVTGGTSNMSIGGLIMQGLFSGFHDGGGKIGVGQFGVVGERGPEIVTATPSGAMVTSRADTARMMQQAVKVDVAVTVDDEGKLQAYVRRVGRAGMAEAVDTVKRNLAGWNAMLSTDGALV